MSFYPKALLTILIFIQTNTVFSQVLKSKTIQRLQNGNWVDTQKTEFNYNENNELTDSITMVLDSLKWNNDRKTSITYNPYESVNSYIRYWMPQDQWKQYQKGYFYYNNSLLIDSTIIQKWDEDNSTWVNQRKLSYTYDNNNNILNFTTNKWENDEWKVNGRVFYTYSSNGDLESYLYENWSSLSNQWSNHSKKEYYYSDDLDSTILQYSNSLGWYNFSKWIYNYNSEGEKISQIEQLWESEKWHNVVKYNYTYNSNNSINYNIIQVWDSTNLDWETLERHVYSYESVITTLNDLVETEINLFPNPCKNNLSIAIEDISKLKHITLFNSEGKILKTIQPKSNEIDVSEFKSGLYLLKIETSSTTIIKQFLKK